MIFDRLLVGWTASAHRGSSREKQYRYSSVADHTLHVGNDGDHEEEEDADIEDLRYVGRDHTERIDDRMRFNRL